MVFIVLRGRGWRRWLTILAGLILSAALLLAAKPVARFLFPFPYRTLIEEAAQREGLDPRLVVALMRTESGFNPQAVSEKGARGLMQVLPATGDWVARQLGLEPFHPDRLFEPAVNIRVGTWYLAYLRNQFAGNIVLAVAAYNGGVTNVRGWLEAGIWDGTLETVAAIPFAETRHYVQRVMLTFRLYRWLYEREEG